jgi:hypothetical protein
MLMIGELYDKLPDEIVWNIIKFCGPHPITKILTPLIVFNRIKFKDSDKMYWSVIRCSINYVGVESYQINRCMDCKKCLYKKNSYDGTSLCNTCSDEIEKYRMERMRIKLDNFLERKRLGIEL